MSIILFSDMDGTLLKKNRTVSAYTEDILQQFIHAGNRIVLTSGRPIHNLLEMQQTLKLPVKGSYLIAYNGSVVYDCDAGRAIYERTVPLTYVNTIFAECNRFGIHCHTYDGDTILCQAEDSELARYRLPIPMPYRITNDILAQLHREPYKVLAIDFEHHDKLEELRSQIMEKTNHQLTAAFSNPYYLECFHLEAGKGNAVRYLTQYLHASIEDTYAAGDEANDISMLDMAGHGIALLNATEEVKLHAEYVTTYDNDDDGLAHFIEQYFI